MHEIFDINCNLSIDLLEKLEDFTNENVEEVEIETESIMSLKNLMQK